MPRQELMSYTECYNELSYLTVKAWEPYVLNITSRPASGTTLLAYELSFCVNRCDVYVAFHVKEKQ